MRRLRCAARTPRRLPRPRPPSRPFRPAPPPRPEEGESMQELNTTPEVGGMGHSIKRKEDGRFIRGKGNYVDDVVLPDMLFMDIVRSPFPHAKILKIDSSRALATPGVLAVITGRDLEKYNLH